MKKPPLRHKTKKNFLRTLSLLLCLILMAALYGAPVQGAGQEEEAFPGTVESFPEGTAPEDTLTEEPAQAETVPEEAPLPENSVPELGTGEPETPPEQDPEESGGPEEPPVLVTLTFQMGPFGSQTMELEQGQYPAEVPEIPALPAAEILGWYNENGDPVDPASIPAEQDAVYTARWARQVGGLLNTDKHSAYIKGYSNGMFKPNKNVTRGEAAQMFYGLLRNKDWEKKSFPDAENNWYTEAVGTMAGLGVLQGYTDGTFRPNSGITRAEFVKIAVSFDTISGGELLFSDVPADFWAAPYIATAASKGWINGFPNGTFHPNDKITRAQAVTVINNMLNRHPDSVILKKNDAKNFYDIFPENWAYGNILEAATNHSFAGSETGEVWTDYEKDTSYPQKSRWVKDGGKRYYLSAKTRKFLRGEQTIDGKTYLLDGGTGAALTGFYMRGSWRRYYQDGLLLDDISNRGLVKGPYFIKVYKNSNYLIIFAKDKAGKYNTPVRAMRVSCGYGTPTGTYYTPYRYRWLQMIGDTWAQWCTQIQGNYLFHSVPNWTQSNADLEVGEYNHLGETRSLGCVRLNCRDAKWIYDNCALGTKVTITTAENSGPLSKPAGLKIPSWHTWDPTDPTAQWLCKAYWCH